MGTREPTVRDVGELRGTRAQDPDATTDLERVYRESGPALWRAIYAYAGGRRHLAEDVVAEAFARAIEHGASIRDPLPWIYRTAFRLASRELQRERSPLPATPDPAPGIDPAEVQDI